MTQNNQTGHSNVDMQSKVTNISQLRQQDIGTKVSSITRAKDIQTTISTKKPTDEKAYVQNLNQKELVQYVKDKHNKPTSLYGSEEYKEKVYPNDHSQTSTLNGPDYYELQRPQKKIFEQKETNLYGNQEDKAKGRKKFDNVGHDSKIFTFQNDIIYIRQRPTCEQKSMVMEFVFNPDKTEPLEQPVKIKNDIILADDRYSEIKKENKNYAEAEKKEKYEMLKKKQERWEYRNNVLQKCYDQLRLEMPQETNYHLLVEKVKQKVHKEHPEVGTIDGIQIRNPVNMKLLGHEDEEEEPFPLSKPTQYKHQPCDEYLDYIQQGHQIPREFQALIRENDYYQKYANGTEEERKWNAKKKEAVYYQSNHVQGSEDQKLMVQKGRSEISKEIQEKYKDSHFVAKKQLKTNDEVNEKLYHTKQEEADKKASIIKLNKFYGGDPNNPMLHDPNEPLITPSEAGRRTHVLKYKSNIMDFDFNDVSKRLSQADIAKKYWQQDETGSKYSINKSLANKSQNGSKKSGEQVNKSMNSKLPSLFKAR